MMNEEILEKRRNVVFMEETKNSFVRGGDKLSIFRQEEWLLDMMFDEDSGRTASVKNE